MFVSQKRFPIEDTPTNLLLVKAGIFTLIGGVIISIASFNGGWLPFDYVLMAFVALSIGCVWKDVLHELRRRQAFHSFDSET